MEKKLEQAFQLAQLWNCVLLLDEADVFLAQRRAQDIDRNALVSGKTLVLSEKMKPQPGPTTDRSSLQFSSGFSIIMKEFSS